MINVTDALFVVNVDSNGRPRLGLRVTDQQSNSMWLNSRSGFDQDGVATLHGMGYEATVRRSNSDRWDFEATIGEQELVGWKHEKHPGNTAGFKPRVGGDLKPVDIDELI